jgi:hypothetical protein
MAELLERPPRKARNWFRFLVGWVVGCVTDPHRHTSSSARLIAFAMTYSLHVYLTRTPSPDRFIVATLVTGGILPLLLRTKSTQKPELLLPRPPVVVAPPEASNG